MEKNCDISESNDGVDFSDKHASELHSDSKPIDQVHGLPKDSWYGQKYFECLVAHDLLFQTAAGEQVSTISATHAKAVRSYRYDLCWDHLCEPSSPIRRFAQATNVSDYRAALFALIGTVIRQGSIEERKTLLALVRKFTGSHPLNSRDGTGEGSQGSEDESFVTKTHSQTNAPETGNLEHPDERGVEISGQQTVQTGLKQEVEHSDNHAPQDEDISGYTSALKEHGDKIEALPDYDYERISLVPPSFRARVVFKEISATGEGKTKKLARHRASKEAWILLGLPPL